MRLLKLETLQSHVPRIYCGKVTGCNGCGWSAAESSTETWADFLRHVPVAIGEGELLLSSEDLKLLREMRIDMGPMEDV